MSLLPEEIPLQEVLSNSEKDPSDRTACRGTPSQIVNLARNLKKSTRLSVYLYIIAHNKVEDRQREFVANFQAKLNLDEIQSALKFLHSLTTNPRLRARMRIPESQELVLRLIPFQRPRPKAPEQRRIGVGYRDKGSLPKRSRPEWDKDNTLWVGYFSQQRETALWDYNILRDPPEDPERKTTEDMSGREKTSRAESVFQNPQGLILTNPEPGVWKISLPNKRPRFGK